MKTIGKISFFLLAILLGVVVMGHLESCNEPTQECVCMPDASTLVGVTELPDMVIEDPVTRDAMTSTIKIGYWDPAAPGIVRSQDIDTNGLPRYNRFRFRMEVDGQVLSDWDFKQELLSWGGKPNGIKDYVPLWQPPSQGYSRTVVDTVIEPETGQTGYIYRTEWVSNQQAYDEYVDFYNLQKDSLELLYRDNFFVQELMWFPSFTYNQNYIYAIYNPDLPYQQRWTEVPYDSVSKWITGAKWKTADPTRVETKEVYYYYVYWSCNSYFRNQIAQWLAYKYLNR